MHDVRILCGIVRLWKSARWDNLLRGYYASQSHSHMEKSTEIPELSEAATYSILF